MPAREWWLSVWYRVGAFLIGTSASLVGDYHSTTVGRFALAAVIIAGLLSTAASSRLFGGRRLVASAAVAEFASAVSLVATTEAATSPFVLAAASPLVMATLSDRRLLVWLTGLAAVALPAATLVEPGRGIAVTIHATAVVLAVPWLTFAARQSAFESCSRNEMAPVVSAADRNLLSELELGLIYAQIAERSGVSPETIKVQVGRLYRHLGAANRQEAIRFGRTHRPPEGAIPERDDETESS